MEFVVSQMNELCRFFPGADQVLEYAEYSDVSDVSHNLHVSNPNSLINSILQSEFCEDDDVDSNQSLYDCRRSADHTPTNNPSQVPEIPQSKSRQEVNESIIQFTKANATNPPRWTNIDEDNTEQRIVPNSLKLDSYHQNGLIKSDLIMKPLSLEVDPNAWELDADHLEFQQLIGNIRKYKSDRLITYLHSAWFPNLFVSESNVKRYYSYEIIPNSAFILSEMRK